MPEIRINRAFLERLKESTGNEKWFYRIRNTEVLILAEIKIPVPGYYGMTKKYHYCNLGYIPGKTLELCIGSRKFMTRDRIMCLIQETFKEGKWIQRNDSKYNYFIESTERYTPLWPGEEPPRYLEEAIIKNIREKALLVGQVDESVYLFTQISKGNYTII